MSYQSDGPATIRRQLENAGGKCPDLKEVCGLLRGWLAEQDQAPLPLDALRASWEQHRARVEGPEGLYEILIEQAPHLTAQVQELQAEHDVIDGDIRRLLAFDRPAAHRHWVAHLADQIDSHCERSAELVYEAFSQEFGGG